MNYYISLSSILVGGLLFVCQHSHATDSRESRNLVATGPGWTLDINSKSRVVDFKVGDGSLSYTYPSQGPTVRDGGDTIIYFVRPRDRQMIVHVRNKACTDSSGASQDKSVTVIIDETGYWGCGSYQ